MRKPVKIKSEKRASKKKERRYPISGRGVFTLQRLKSKIKNSAIR